MFGNNLVFWWCCALLHVASSSKHQRNFTNSNKKHNISKLQYKIDETSIKNYDDERKIVISTIYKFNKTDYNEDSNEYFVPHKICVDDTCFLTCCHLDDHLTECIPGETKILYAFVDGQYSLQSKKQEINLTSYGLLYDPCQKIKYFYIFKYLEINKNVFIANDTVYSPYHAEFVESKSFCLIDKNKNLLHHECDITTFNTLFPTEIFSRILIYTLKDPDNPLKPILYHHISIRISLRIISILFLLIIFLVYSILPQLRNKHGFILRNFIGATIIAYIFESVNKINLGNYFIESIIDSICYFAFLATYFWSTVMSFDMWWTFRDISSLLANMRNRQRERGRKMKERKKLIMYSVYAWGSSFILTIVCIIMDSVPPVIFSLLRPEFSIIFWFTNEYIKIGLYYWILLTICSISSICLFISTTLKIQSYEKNIYHYLINFDSWVYDYYKNYYKWSNLSQKSFIMTFIVIGISTFVIGIVSLIFSYTPNLWYISYIAQATDMAQNIGIFTTYVCKKRIKKLLLMRFGYQNYNVPPIARQTEVVTDSNTRTIRSRMIRLHERINLWQTNRRRNNMHDETAM